MSIELRDFKDGLVPALHIKHLTEADIKQIEGWINDEQLICPGSKKPHPTDDLLILKSEPKIAKNALNTDLTFVDTVFRRGTVVAACSASKSPEYLAAVDTAKRIQKSSGNIPVIVLWNDCYRVIERKWVG